MLKPLMTIAVLVPALALAGCGTSAPAAAPDAAAKPPGLHAEATKNEGGPPPGAVALWAAPKDVAARIADAGVETLTEAFQTYHLHVHMEVWKDGKQVVVPASLGIAPDESYHSPIHTHTTSGVIHVESPSKKDFTVGQIFKLWGVPLDGAKVIVDGEVVPDPANAKLGNLQLITVEFGGQ